MGLRWLLAAWLLGFAWGRLPLRRRSASQTGRGCTNSDAFYFSVQPKDVSIREGGRAYLECSVSNRCNIKFLWSLDEAVLQNTTRRSLLSCRTQLCHCLHNCTSSRYQNGSNLIITRVNRTLDAGVFKCLATYTATGAARESTQAQLSILCTFFSSMEIGASVYPSPCVG